MKTGFWPPQCRKFWSLGSTSPVSINASYLVSCKDQEPPLRGSKMEIRSCWRHGQVFVRYHWVRLFKFLSREPVKKCKSHIGRAHSQRLGFFTWHADWVRSIANDAGPLNFEFGVPAKQKSYSMSNKRNQKISAIFILSIILSCSTYYPTQPHKSKNTYLDLTLYKT
jgi:hypothetical protein